MRILVPYTDADGGFVLPTLPRGRAWKIIRGIVERHGGSFLEVEEVDGAELPPVDRLALMAGVDPLTGQVLPPPEGFSIDQSPKPWWNNRITPPAA